MWLFQTFLELIIFPPIFSPALLPHSPLHLNFPPYYPLFPSSYMCYTTTLSNKIPLFPPYQWPILFS